MAQALAQAFTQFADVTFYDILVDMLVENAVNSVEKLGFRDALALMRHEIFKDTALAPWQRQA